MVSPSLNRLCVQYYIYWLDQNCFDILPIADHKYDYEPILAFHFNLPTESPVGMINEDIVSGLGMARDFIRLKYVCKSSRTEISTNINLVTRLLLHQVILWEEQADYLGAHVLRNIRLLVRFI